MYVEPHKESLQDAITRLQREREENSHEPTRAKTLDDAIRELQAARNATPEYTNENDLSTLGQAFGIGAANMVNDTVVGGLLGYVPGALGRGVEYISPFSGENKKNQEAIAWLKSRGIDRELLADIPTYEDSWLTSGAKSAL